jgi:serine O-acetyltransferase
LALVETLISTTGPRLARPAHEGPADRMWKRKRPDAEAWRAWRLAITSQHPRFLEAVLEDARFSAANRGERFEFRSRFDGLVQAARLAVVTDAFFAQVLYRLKARAQALHIPVVPMIAHRLAIMTGQVSIGDPVVMRPGVYLPHGQVVIDGLIVIEKGTMIAPFVTIGLIAGNLQGPTIEPRVNIGTGAKILGPIRVGANSFVGANAVVIHDVAPGATVVGVPAHAVERRGVIDGANG